MSVSAGSSPRGRGKLEIIPQVRIVIGLIPAWAGKTVAGDDAGDGRGAHPRVGGENPVTSSSNRHPPGSSPRGRGKPRGQGRSRVDRRLIPAWAGKTRISVWKTAAAAAHPRVGGENVTMDRVFGDVRGSSPRGRGKLGARNAPSWTNGLIPAWAGKTLINVTQRSISKAHPRVGGENISGLFIDAAAKGSSPRGRGKPPCLSRHASA